MRDLKKDLKTQTKKASNKDAIAQILDENNTENITLFDSEGKPIEFEQIAVIPLENKLKQEDLYAILIPITPMQGVNEGEGVVIKVKASDVEVVNDQDTIDRVLDVYQKLLEEGE